MIRDSEYDEREARGEAREADETARWMVRIGERLHAGQPVSERDREIYEHNIKVRWSA